ncbi:MAG: LysE/ArgO family amino acid transporter [Bacillota bacterium]
MYNYLLQGLMLGFAYVAPIGMQNIYVINTALSKSRLRAYQVAFITIFFDITLALACFFGMGAVMEASMLLKSAILAIGCIAVVIIGVNLIRSKPKADSNVDVNKSLTQVIITCFTVTWINPQALIDGSLLLGGYRASLPAGTAGLFIIGVCLASFTWFTGLSTLVSVFRKGFNNKLIRLINVVCGGIIIYFGLKLGYSFITAVF